MINYKEYGYIYIMTNLYNTTLYVGVTSDLKRRIYEHKNKLIEGFSQKYNLTKLLYYEKYNSIIDAIKREKQIKNFKKEWKIDLIKQSNPYMVDLYNWLNGLENKLKIETKIINNKGIIYEIPNCAIADRTSFVRNDVSYDIGRGETLQEIKIQCPAKINLTLKVLNKREDGFHNIESIMQTINLYDYLTITVEPAAKTEIFLSGNSTEIPYNEKNLVYKAATLFPMPSPHKINIYIEKNIPIAAGLAGGSTDAAGTLFGLNELFARPLSQEELHQLCAQLGSDLNFCLEGGRQMTKGRGEILEKLEFKEFDLSLIKPENLGISAKEAYTKFSEKKYSPRPLREREKFLSEQSELRNLGEGSNNEIATSSKARYAMTYLNDLEWAVIDDYEELKKIKKLYPESMMSGSGSTYFIIGQDFKPMEGYQIFNGLKSIPYGVKKDPQ